MGKTTTTKIISKKHLARLERERRRRHYLLTGVIAIVVVVLAVVGYGLLDQFVLKGLRPVAQVGDQKISLTEFQTRVRFNRYQAIQQYSYYSNLVSMFGTDQSFSAQFTQQLESIKSQLSSDGTNTMALNAVSDLIDEAVIAREAKTRNITVTDQEVDEELQSQFGFFPNGTPIPTITPTTAIEPTLSALQLTLTAPTLTPTVDVKQPTTTPTMTPTAEPTAEVEPTEADVTPTVEITETPEPTATAYTMEGYQSQLKVTIDEMKKIQFSEQDLRKVVYNSLLRKKLEAAITADEKPEQEQVWARHILVADEAAAKAVLERLNKGEDWYKVCAEVSTDSGSKDEGGDLGWFGKAQMIEEFETAAFSLEVGKTSEPIKTSYGYHIIQVLGHETRALTAAQFDELRSTKFNEWLTTQKEAEDIQQFDTVWEGVVPMEPTLDANAQ